MRYARVLLLLAVVVVLAMITGCGSSPLPQTSSDPPAPSPRSYNGTASVGDFLDITLDPAAQTLSYTNHSNGDIGTVPYSVNADGSYTLNDPAGNMLSAYEVPNYAMLIEAAKTGPGHNTPSLITAVEKASATSATWAGQRFNYMQFRTNSGGLETGSISLDALSNITVTSYWPYGALNMSEGGEVFGESSFPGSGLVQDAAGSFLKLDDGHGGTNYIFGTPSGIFLVDTQQGALLGFREAASKDFDPKVAGSYNSVYYQKVNANMGENDEESGTPSLGHATVTVDTLGGIIARDIGGNVLLQATLTPVADASYLYGPSKLKKPCYGLFTLRQVQDGTTQDVFVTFVDRAMLFSSFGSRSQTQGTYEYLYGVGLK